MNDNISQISSNTKFEIKNRIPKIVPFMKSCGKNMVRPDKSQRRHDTAQKKMRMLDQITAARNRHNIVIHSFI